MRSYLSGSVGVIVELSTGSIEFRICILVVRRNGFCNLKLRNSFETFGTTSSLTLKCLDNIHLVPPK